MFFGLNILNFFFHSYESVVSTVPLAATIILIGMVCITYWLFIFFPF